MSHLSNGSSAASEQKYIVLNNAGNAMQLHEKSTPTTFIVRAQYWKHATKFNSIEEAMSHILLNKNGEKTGKILEYPSLKLVAKNGVILDAPITQLIPYQQIF